MADQAEKIKEVLTRGVENIYPSPEALGKVLASGKKIKLYTGIDPTGDLHIGHGVVLNKLRQFQQLGHHVIVLIGDFTATVGDPTDKAATRKPLTKKQVLTNAKNYKALIGKTLDLKKTEFRFNSAWLSKMKVDNFFELISHFTVQRLLERDMFANRLKEGRPIHAHEFLYPVLVGYDCVALDVDLELGGNDQTFNMLAGRTLMKSLKNKEKFVMATKLLVDPTGKKMGKTEGNMVNLDDSPQDIYGKVMSWPDTLIVTAMEIATDIPMAEVKQVGNELAAGKNPKILKMLLAYKLVEKYHSTTEAIKAEENFKQVFEEGLNPDEIPVFKIKTRRLVDVLVETKLASSRTEARRLIVQGGIKVDTKKVTDENFVISKLDADGVVIQKGKRHFAKILK
ncbi:MAG: tyrosine--tRNA ligase [Patescibacteria group bacterium]|nr:tyrosine--tRNA ligase [Patescibacteria group bacterium]